MYMLVHCLLGLLLPALLYRVTPLCCVAHSIMVKITMARQPSQTECSNSRNSLHCAQSSNQSRPSVQSLGHHSLCQCPDLVLIATVEQYHSD